MAIRSTLVGVLVVATLAAGCATAEQPPPTLVVFNQAPVGGDADLGRPDRRHGQRGDAGLRAYGT